MAFKLTLHGVDELEAKLIAMNSIRFDAVALKSMTQMLNRARASGGTPVDCANHHQPTVNRWDIPRSTLRMLNTVTGLLTAAMFRGSITSKEMLPRNSPYIATICLRL